jgi:hypothetical protein
VAVSPEQQKELDRTAEELFAFAENLWIIKGILEDRYNKKFKEKILVSSPYINFRDAVFHYEKMYDAAHAKDNDTFIKEQVCVNDHLDRGLKDFFVFHCFNYYVQILHGMMEDKSKIVIELLPKLRNVYHKFKNIVVKVRISGQTVKGNDNTEMLKEIHNTIEELYNLLDKHKSLSRVYDKYANTVSKKLIKNSI